MIELIYSGECPYCRFAAKAVGAADVQGKVRLTAIESERGQQKVIDHHGEYKHAPHLFTDDLVYYGVGPTAKGLLKEYRRA